MFPSRARKDACKNAGADIASDLGSDVVPKPKWTYQETLARIESPPNVTFTSGDPLNQTSLVPYEAWNSNFVTNRDFARSERNHSKYG